MSEQLGELGYTLQQAGVALDVTDRTVKAWNRKFGVPVITYAANGRPRITPKHLAEAKQYFQGTGPRLFQRKA